jgi:membrane-associated phospholipid phosphatase
MRIYISMLVVAVVLVFPALATAQEVPALLNDSGTALLQDQTPSTGNGTDKAQQPPAAVGEEGTKPTRGFFSALGHNLSDDVKHIPRRNSAYWLVAGTALALAVHPEDKKINAHLIGHTNPFKAGQIIGQTGTLLGAAAGTYLIGRFTDSRRAQHLGMDEIEALLLSEGIVEGAKQIIRRDRPLLPDGTPQSGFSMPSGHATITFAAATVLQQHLGYRAAIPTYLVATYVAMSRLHDNRHFASDVVMGAATGVIIGRSVTWHGRNFYGSPALVPGGGAILIAAR